MIDDYTDSPETDETRRYSDIELTAILETELRQALGHPTSEVGRVRLRNLQFYKAEPVGELSPPEVPDRSQLVASDVADTVDGLLPQLMRMFVANDAVELRAKRPQFEAGARQATEYLNYIFYTKNRGFDELFTFFKDALIQKVGFAKVWWEECVEDSIENYDNLTEPQVIGLMSDSSIELIGQTAKQIQIDPNMPPMTVYDVQVRKRVKSGKPCVVAVPPEEMRIHRRARYNEELEFIAQERFEHKKDLEALGYDLSYCAAQDEDVSAEALERRSLQGSFQYAASTDEQVRYRVSECYIKLDMNKDGVPEWLKVTLIGGKLMEWEQVDDHPFVYFCPIPSPHVFFGECPADRALEPQRLNTSLIRAIADNAYLSVNKRIGAVENQVNIDDLLNSRPGGVVRLKQPNALVPIEQNGLDAATWQLVEWTAQWNERRTGFYRNSAGLDSDAINKTAYGVAVLANKQDQQVELMARIAAESVRRMFVKMLKMIGMYQNIPETVKLTGGWVDVDPREWHNQYQVSVSVGLGAGSRDQRTQNGMLLLNIQKQLVERGVYDVAPVIEVARDIAKAVGYERPETVFPDPKPPQPAAPPIELQKAKMETESRERIESKKIQADQAKTLMELAAGIISARTQAQTVNLINGTQLDQTAQAPGVTPENVMGLMNEIGAMAAQMQGNPQAAQGMPNG